MSREADIRYEPKCKELINAVCFPDLEDIKKMGPMEREIHIKILDHYIITNEEGYVPNRRGLKGDTDGGDF